MFDVCAGSLSHFLAAAADVDCERVVGGIDFDAAPPLTTRLRSVRCRFFRSSVHAINAPSLAARHGHVEAVRFLLGFGFPAEEIFNALRSACEFDREKVVRMLLETA
jgi:hypothetical protein